jgi:hypothetical protein
MLKAFQLFHVKVKLRELRETHHEESR